MRLISPQIKICFGGEGISPFGKIHRSLMPYSYVLKTANATITRIFHEFEAFICKAFSDAAVLMLPQVPDNAANGRLELARRLKTFMLLCIQ